MSESTNIDIEKLKWLVDMKNSNPEKYKKFWIDMKDVVKDMFRLLYETQKEMEEEWKNK